MAGLIKNQSMQALLDGRSGQLAAQVQADAAAAKMKAATEEKAAKLDERLEAATTRKAEAYGLAVATAQQRVSSRRRVWGAC